VLVKNLAPAAPPKVLEAACGLRYRDFLIVALTCRKPDIFPDNWIYIHSGETRVGRIQNFRNWSPDMVAEGTGTTLGMEYFCSRGDDLWTMSDADLVALAKNEISKLGLAEKSDLGLEGHVIRELNAYPVYDAPTSTASPISKPSVEMACTATTTKTTPCSPATTPPSASSAAPNSTPGKSTPSAATTKSKSSRRTKSTPAPKSSSPKKPHRRRECSATLH
jgi:hypothetical protein